jgi:hypothetical protein
MADLNDPAQLGQVLQMLSANDGATIELSIVRFDCAVARQSLSDNEAIAHGLQNNCAVVVQQLRIGCKVIAKRLRIDCASIAHRLRIDCKVIAK